MHGDRSIQLSQVFEQQSEAEKIKETGSERREKLLQTRSRGGAKIWAERQELLRRPQLKNGITNIRRILENMPEYFKPGSNPIGRPSAHDM